jgi:hypothetical protein
MRKLAAHQSIASVNSSYKLQLKLHGKTEKDDKILTVRPMKEPEKVN